jgi:hypothetical protein
MGDADALEWFETPRISTLSLAKEDCIGFPETIDKLDPEIGQIGGPKPIIFGMFHSHLHISSLTLDTQRDSTPRFFPPK